MVKKLIFASKEGGSATEGSCRFPLIVLQQTTQPFLATHNSVIPAHSSIRQGEQDPVLLALVIALFGARWRRDYGSMVRRLQRDRPELLSFFAFPRHLWRRLRTTNVIERCFVEVRRRTRPMVCFVNVESVDRIIYSIFQRFNLEWKTRTLSIFTQAA